MLIAVTVCAMVFFAGSQKSLNAAGVGSKSELALNENASHLSASGKQFDHELARVNKSIRSLEALVAKTPNSWPNLERLALAHLDRARLTGEFEDYRRADNTIALAFTKSEVASGPLLSRAQIHLALHRTEAALSDLQQMKSHLLIDKDSATLVAELTGEALLQSGDTENALVHLMALNSRNPSFENAARVAHAYAKAGDYNLAAQWLTRAEQRTVGHSEYIQAWLALQHGILALEQRQLDDAYDAFSLADRLFPGYWLIEEHLAEVDALSGRTTLAERRYRDINDRVDNPQMMLALADVLETNGAEENQSEIAQLRDRANARLSQISESHPRFAAAH